MPQPTITSDAPRYREFVTTVIAMQAVIVNSAEQILLLSSPTRKNGWQTVSGAMDANETLLDGTLREIHEEVGSAIQVRPLGVVHAQSFHYDASVRYTLATYYLFAYLGGAIQPGDDMIGSEVRWWSLAELETTNEPLSVMAQPWLMRRAVEQYRNWIKQPNQPLQTEI